MSVPSTSIPYFDFEAVLIGDYEIKLIDNTVTDGLGAPLTINSMTLDIISSQIEEPIYGLDIPAYIYTHKKDRELYSVDSSILYGISNLPIKDGVYKFIITTNNTDVTEYKCIIFNTIRKTVAKLLADSSYNVIVGNYDVQYTGDNSKGNTELIRLAINLLDNLHICAANNDEVGANDTLDKLNRLLTII